jgi:hypothetical protein
MGSLRHGRRRGWRLGVGEWRGWRKLWRRRGQQRGQHAIHGRCWLQWADDHHLRALRPSARHTGSNARIGECYDIAIDIYTYTMLDIWGCVLHYNSTAITASVRSNSASDIGTYISSDPLGYALGRQVRGSGSPESPVTAQVPAIREWRRRGSLADGCAKTRLCAPPDPLLSVWASSQIYSWHRSFALVPSIARSRS